MRVLLVGAFGNVGYNVLQELLRQGYEVRCFDLKNTATEKKAQAVMDKAEVVWGDVRNADVVQAALKDQDIVIHLAFIIPPTSDEQPELASTVNIEGTRNIIQAAEKQSPAPKLLFSSTLNVFGHTQSKQPPRTVDDPIEATDLYTTHKIACEKMVRESALQWAIYRFADVPLFAPRAPHPIMFRIPLDTRIENIHPRDVAVAVVNGLACPIWGKIWLIGGGPTCQVTYREYIAKILEGVGVGMLPEQAFGHDEYCTDWLDTTESQALLQFQQYSFDEIASDLITSSRPPLVVRLLLPVIRPLVRRSVLKHSPYLLVSFWSGMHPYV